MWLGRSDAITFLPPAVTLAEEPTTNVSSPLAVVTVNVLVAASYFDTVPVAVTGVALAAAFAGFSAAGLVAGFGAGACANAGADRATIEAAIAAVLNIKRIHPPDS